MKFSEFTQLLKAATTITSNMFANEINIDNTVYTLKNAILESNWNEFKVMNIHCETLYEYSLSNAKDKETKEVMTSRYSIRFNDNARGITFEYNNNAEFLEMV